MDCFLKILYAHARRWRAMTPCDAVKLAYQSVYGPGHMIADPALSLERLRKEYASLGPENSAFCSLSDPGA